MTFLEGVPLLEPLEDWLENLWNWIGEAAHDAADWLWDQIQDKINFLRDKIDRAFNTLYNAVKKWIETTEDNIVSWIKGLWDEIETGFKHLGDSIKSEFENLQSSISTMTEDLKTTMGEHFKNLQDHISTGLSDLGGNLQEQLNKIHDAESKMLDDLAKSLDTKSGEIQENLKEYFDGAMQGFADAITSVLPSSFNAVAAWLNKNVVEPIWNGLQWAWNMIIGKFEEVYKGLEGEIRKLAPMTPEKAASAAAKIYLSAAGIGLAATGLTSVLGIKVLGSGLPVGEIGHYLKDLINPGLITSMFLGTLLAVSIQTPLRQYYNQLFRPRIPSIDEAKRMLWRGIISMEQFIDVVQRSGFGEPWQSGFIELTKNIPGPSDLIRFVVKEVISPEDFKKYMAMQGYSSFWADAYWEEHWRTIAETRIHEAYHRGIITREERDKYLVILDYKPTPRPGLTKSDLDIIAGLAKEMIPRVDLRRAWELGEIDDQELIKRYEWLGYEDDAPLMARIQKRIAMEALINRLIDNLKKDFVEGFIDEDYIRSSLRALGIKDEIIEYHIEDAKSDRLRNFKKDLVDLYIDSYVKDIPGWDEETLRQALQEIIVVPEVVELLINKAYVRKYRRPRRAS